MEQKEQISLGILDSIHWLNKLSFEDLNPLKKRIFNKNRNVLGHFDGYVLPYHYVEVF